MRQRTLFDAVEEPTLFGVDSLDGLDDGLSGIDREKFKKHIVDLVTHSLFEWKKPWTPFENNNFITINGRITLAPCNAYSRKPYGANAANLLEYTKEFNMLYNVEFAPVFITESMCKKNDWHLKYNQLSNRGLSGITYVYEAYWAKVTDEKIIKRLKERLEKGEALPFGFILASDKETFLQRATHQTEVVLAQNIVEAPFNIEIAAVSEAQRIEYIDSIIEAYSPRVAKVFHDEQDKCYYIPAFDQIHLVPAKNFSSINEYYSTRFHETVHSTHGGNPVRIKRDFGRKTWGNVGYAMEELVAEIGAMLLCAELGIKYYAKGKIKNISDEEHNSIAYIGSWLKQARNLYKGDDEKTLLVAYSHAERAVNYILKDIDFESYIPQSVKDQSEAAADIVLCDNEMLKAVNVVSDGYIRLFFVHFAEKAVRKELEDLGFHYSRAFKCYQIRNDENGVEAWEKWRQKHVQTIVVNTPQERDNDDIELARAKAVAAIAILELMKIKR